MTAQELDARGLALAAFDKMMAFGEPSSEIGKLFRFAGKDWFFLSERDEATIRAYLASQGAQPVASRVRVPSGQTPLDDNLQHRLLDVFNEGGKARDSGSRSPYHGHSLEHCLHAAGWVSRDLRLALDAKNAAHPEAQPVGVERLTRERDEAKRMHAQAFRLACDYQARAEAAEAKLAALAATRDGGYEP